MFVSVVCRVFFLSRSLCEGPITRLGETYRVCVCIVVCDLETSRLLVVCDLETSRILVVCDLETSRLLVVCDLETSRLKRPWPALGCCTTTENVVLVKILFVDFGSSHYLLKHFIQQANIALDRQSVVSPCVVT